MKKIKMMLLLCAAVVASAGFTSCTDDEAVTVSNMERYQQEVDAAVAKAKQHDRAILLVAFGSTWQQAYDAFDLTRSEYAREFTGYDVYLSFSSAICINRARAAENTDARDFYEPKYWLEALGRKQYKEIIVQSMQVIPGEEYSRVVNAVKDFANNSNGDLDDEYLSKVTLRMGLPLMANADTDVENLATALDANFHSYASQGAVLFMGHGNPDEYDTYKANIRYTQLEAALQQKSGNYFVGTVDMADNFKVQVQERMAAAGILSGDVYCAPLMSIAGDHAHNDMAGDDDAWDSETQSFEVNEEGEVEDTSWKLYFEHLGYTTTATGTYVDEGEKALVRGLLEYSNIRALYKQHTRDAETVDYYHSMYPED